MEIVDEHVPALKVDHLSMPWKYCGCGKCGQIHHPESGMYIGMTVSYDRDVETPSYAQKVANARFIVQAVNAHDVMLEALESAYEYLSETLSPCDSDCECMVHSMALAIELAKKEG